MTKLNKIEQYKNGIKGIKSRLNSIKIVLNSIKIVLQSIKIGAQNFLIPNRTHVFWFPFGTFGTLLDYLKPFRSIWNHFGPFQTILDHFGQKILSCISILSRIQTKSVQLFLEHGRVGKNHEIGSLSFIFLPENGAKGILKSKSKSLKNQLEMSSEQVELIYRMAIGYLDDLSVKKSISFYLVGIHLVMKSVLKELDHSYLGFEPVLLKH